MNKENKPCSMEAELAAFKLVSALCKSAEQEIFKKILDEIKDQNPIYVLPESMPKRILNYGYWEVRQYRDKDSWDIYSGENLIISGLLIEEAEAIVAAHNGALKQATIDIANRCDTAEAGWDAEKRAHLIMCEKYAKLAATCDNMYNEIRSIVERVNKYN